MLWLITDILKQWLMCEILTTGILALNIWLRLYFILLLLYFIVVSGGEHVDVIIGAAVADGKVTPKVQSLIKVLLNYQHTEDFRAIIFVERVVAALVLPKVDKLTLVSF